MEKKGKNIQVGFSEPLHREDSEVQTYGCRHTNPDICKFNRMEDICAFASDDRICKNPSRAWKKKYNELNR